MKAVLAAIMLLVSVNAMALDACMTGSFYDPEQEGFGINVEAHQGFTAAYFYTFDKNLRPIWFVMVGKEVLTMSVTAVVKDNDVFITKELDVGVAEIVPLADGLIRFRYSLIAEYDVDRGALVLCRGDHCEGDYLFRQLTIPIACK
mgnify:CR=1 FL=1